MIYAKWSPDCDVQVQDEARGIRCHCELGCNYGRLKKTRGGMILHLVRHLVNLEKVPMSVFLALGKGKE